MTDDSSTNSDLRNFVPESLIRRIKEHISESIAKSVRLFHLNEADEDSLTGALGQALSTSEQIVVVENGIRYTCSIESYKIGGKGIGAPESRTGADGIFQVCVLCGNQPIFRKGLPFQAKKISRYYEREAIPQAEMMLNTSGTGIVVRFGPKGYDAADARNLKKDSSNVPPAFPGFAPLNNVLGDKFLRCFIGKIGLAFDRKVSDPNVPKRKGFWVISTNIQRSDS